jgi:ubiquinone/menaquinone biosynthesis C-methylase UbiE
LRHQHQARFVLASEAAIDLTVADVACGDGSGAREMLVRGARRVDAFDISREAAAAARRRLPDGNSLCCVADATSLPVRDAIYDLLVSFETIEHVLDDGAFLDEVVRVVKPGGTFMCSTPNRGLLDPGTSIADKPFNRFHVREYSFHEFRALLIPRFSAIEWLGQSFYRERYVRALEALGYLQPRLAVRLHQLRKLIGAMADRPVSHKPRAMREDFQPEVFIAICRVV